MPVTFTTVASRTAIGDPETGETMAVDDREDTGGSRPGAGVSIGTICQEWSRIGCTGFGGPPTHLILLRRLCVDERQWLTPREFEDGVAVTNLLPGPASTQMAIFCAWRLRGTLGGIVGGLCFIVPGLVLILGLAAVLLARHPPSWVLGTAAGAGAAVPAVALKAASSFVPASWQRIGSRSGQRVRWLVYALVGGIAAATLGSFLVVALLACGLTEMIVRQQDGRMPGSARVVVPAVVGHAVAVGGMAALVFVALKVGALSYGGGFVIIPLMQHDAVSTYHFMTNQQFLSAVALGQVTPGPVVQTVAVVGYAAGGIGGGLLASFVAFAPSFVFVIAGGRHFDAVRSNTSVQSFLTGAAPAVIGAIAGSAIPLGLSFQNLWQVPVLALALLWLFPLRRGVVSLLLLAGAVGLLLALAGVRV
jgi:chromate transporter